MKVIGSRSRSHEQNVPKSIFPQCITSISNNSGSIKHRAIKFACSMGFSDMRIKWRDSHLCQVTKKLPSVTKCTHSRPVVVGHRRECHLVITRDRIIRSCNHIRLVHAREVPAGVVCPPTLGPPCLKCGCPCRALLAGYEPAIYKGS